MAGGGTMVSRAAVPGLETTAAFGARPAGNRIGSDCAGSRDFYEDVEEGAASAFPRCML